MNSSLSAKGKLLIALFIGGLIFSLLVTWTTSVITSIGLESVNSVGGIVSAMFSGDLMATGLVFLTTVLFGVYIWIFGFIASRVKSMITKERKPKLQGRPRLLALFIIGLIGVGIFSIFDEAVAGAGTSTSTDDLIANATGLNIVGLTFQIVAFAIYGMIAIGLGTKFAWAESKLPDVAKKI